MAGLEDKILKQNIPGKYTWWDKDSDEVGPGARAEWLDPDESDPEKEMTELEKQKKWVESDCPETVRRTIMARQAKENARAQTGPKAVLADHKAFQDSMRAERALEKQYREAMLLRMAGGGRPVPSVEGPTEEELEAALMAAQQDQDGSCSDDDDSDDYDDEAFLEEYRRMRLRDLKKKDLVSAGAEAPEFGQVREVERQEFVHEVDSVPANVHVVVHIYEPYIHACQSMNRALEIIAKSAPHVKFLRMLSGQTGDDYDHVALPTLMVYKGKELVACSTRVMDDIGENFSKGDVEWLLAEYGVIDAVPSTEGPKPLI